MIKGIVIGFILAIAILVGSVFLYFSAGLAPVATAGSADAVREEVRQHGAGRAY